MKTEEWVKNNFEAGVSDVALDTLGEAAQVSIAISLKKLADYYTAKNGDTVSTFENNLGYIIR